MDSSIPMTMPNDISFVDVLVQWLETPGVDSKGNTRTPGDILRDYMKWHAQQHPRADPVPMLKTVVGQALQEYATNHKDPSAKACPPCRWPWGLFAILLALLGAAIWAWRT